MSNQQADVRQHEQEMREAFEKWYSEGSEKPVDFTLIFEGGNHYANDHIDWSWWVWQAATLAAEETFNQRLVELTSRIRELEAMLLVVDCCETIQRMQTHSDKPKDYWQVKMKGITDPYWRARDDIKPLLKSIHEDLFSDAALTESNFTSSLERQYKENQG